MSPEGEIHHLSHVEAWKQFNLLYPAFAVESRNIYLWLSTVGFNSIGMSGEAHSVWHMHEKGVFFLLILVLDQTISSRN